MNLEEAIKTSIVYETKVRDTYRQARDSAKTEPGVRIFKALAEEEELHIDYLNSRLIEWKKDGRITAEKLGTTIPTKEAIQKATASLQKKLSDQDFGTEMEMLRRAYQLESETSEFYRTMVGQMKDEGQKMFARFMEIEEGHVAIVKAELDCLSGMGYWFDFQEFNLED